MARRLPVEFEDAIYHHPAPGATCDTLKTAAS